VQRAIPGGNGRVDAMCVSTRSQWTRAVTSSARCARANPRSAPAHRTRDEHHADTDVLAHRGASTPRHPEPKRADYGRNVIERLAAHLAQEFREGFSRANLFNMVRFAEVFPDRQIVQTLSGQLTWSHLRSSRTDECALRASGTATSLLMRCIDREPLVVRGGAALQGLEGGVITGIAVLPA
jgi:hypothetical protein